MTTTETLTASERANRADHLAWYPNEWLRVCADLERLRQRVNVLRDVGIASLDRASQEAFDLLGECANAMTSGAVMVGLDDAAEEAAELAEPFTDAAIAREELAEV